jgi:hypothetical protein
MRPTGQKAATDRIGIAHALCKLRVFEIDTGYFQGTKLQSVLPVPTKCYIAVPINKALHESTAACHRAGTSLLLRLRSAQAN